MHAALIGDWVRIGKHAWQVRGWNSSFPLPNLAGLGSEMTAAELLHEGLSALPTPQIQPLKAKAWLCTFPQMIHGYDVRMRIRISGVVLGLQRRSAPRRGLVALRCACLALALLSWALAGCCVGRPSQSLLRYQFRQPHMGTLFTITLYAPDEDVAQKGSDAAFAKIAALDRMLTDYDPDSELMQLCRRPVDEPTRVSDELFQVLQKSQQIAAVTDGAFDVTIGPLVRLWRRARRTETLPTPEQLSRARESVGWRKLKLDPRARTVTLTVPSMQLDLGGIAKGYAADKALEELRRLDLSCALVAASGDIAVGEPPPGKKAWRVEIGTSGRTNDQSPRILLLKDVAVSTSGDAEQFVEIDGKRYSHIVDPRTGAGLTEGWQVSVVAGHATETDAFATAASVLGLERGLPLIKSQPGLKAVFVRNNSGDLEIHSTGAME
jgi:thiamine biosynthesis lipoprotein